MKHLVLIFFICHFLIGQSYTEEEETEFLEIQLENISDLKFDSVSIAGGAINFKDVSSKSSSNKKVSHNIPFFSPIAVTARGKEYKITSKLAGNTANLPIGKYTYQIDIVEEDQIAILNFIVH